MPDISKGRTVRHTPALVERLSAGQVRCASAHPKPYILSQMAHRAPHAGLGGALERGPGALRERARGRVHIRVAVRHLRLHAAEWQPYLLHWKYFCNNSKIGSDGYVALLRWRAHVPFRHAWFRWHALQTTAFSNHIACAQAPGRL